jgi:hypothetical protein
MGSNPLFNAYAYTQLLCGVKLNQAQFYALLAALLQYYIRISEKTSYKTLICLGDKKNEDSDDSDNEQDENEDEPPKKKQKIEQSDEQSIANIGHLELPSDVLSHIALFLKTEDVFNLTQVNANLFLASESAYSMWVFDKEEDDEDEEENISKPNKNIKLKYQWLAHKIIEKLNIKAMEKLIDVLQSAISKHFPITISIIHKWRGYMARIYHNTAKVEEERAGDHYYNIPESWAYEPDEEEEDDREYNEVSLTSFSIDDIIAMKYSKEAEDDMNRFLRVCLGDVDKLPEITLLMQTRMRLSAFE